MERFQPFLKTLLLVALGVFLYSRIANGTLFYYINERFAIFTLIGVVGLLLLGVSYRWDNSHVHAADDADNHDHDHHTHSHALSWSGALIVALPVVLGLLVTPQPLGSAALANRDVSLSMNESALPIGLRQQEKAALDKNIMDWWHEYRKSASAGAELVGQPVRVTGFVFRDEQFGRDHFLITRFVVSCCVADANVLGLLVDPAALALTAAVELTDDQWIEVQGVFTASTLDGWHMPVVVAEQITPVAVPDQPYLYP